MNDAVLELYDQGKLGGVTRTTRTPRSRTILSHAMTTNYDISKRYCIQSSAGLSDRLVNYINLSHINMDWSTVVVVDDETIKTGEYLPVLTEPSNGSFKNLLDKHVKHYTKNVIEKYAMGMFNVLKPGMITPDVMEYLEKNNFDLRAIIAVEEAIIKKVQPPDNGNMKPVGRNISRTINSFEGWVRCMLAMDESSIEAILAKLKEYGVIKKDVAWTFAEQRPIITPVDLTEFPALDISSVSELAWILVPNSSNLAKGPMEGMSSEGSVVKHTYGDARIEVRYQL
jgi:hypothetical protein